MKITSIVIQNIGLIANEVIAVNKPLILFYGEIRNGKTTILNAVRWCCGGEFPEDILRHGADEGKVELHFDGGMIGRTWYRAKDGKTKARAVTFVRAGKPVPQPVSEIRKMLNPFLLDQDFLRNKTELDRKKYFTELFGVDTTEIDTELFNIERQASELRVKVKAYGTIDLTKFERVDVDGLRRELEATRAEDAAHRRELEAELQKINQGHADHVTKVGNENASIAAHNAEWDARNGNRNDLEVEISELEQRIVALRNKQTALSGWLEQNPKRTPKAPTAAPNTDALRQMILDTHNTAKAARLQTAIEQAGAQNAKADQYEANVARDQQKQADNKALAELEKTGRELKQKKQAKLKEVSDTCGVPGLEFDDNGNFIFEGVTAGMISDSQIIRLSSLLSAVYPEGFGLDLIDRAESLGKSVFEFVERAKKENKSILATIVGEKPAEVPEDVGVFVVEKGKLK